MWRCRIHRGKFKPTYRTYNTRNRRLLDISAGPPLKGRGLRLLEGRGDHMEKPEYGGLGPRRVGALCWLFQQPCFPKARKNGHKRGALSRGSVQQRVSLQEHDLANLKTAASACPACMGVGRTFEQVLLKVEMGFGCFHTRLSWWNSGGGNLSKCILGCVRSYFPSLRLTCGCSRNQKW